MTNYKALHAYMVGALCYLVATISIGLPWSFILFAALGNICHYIAVSLESLDKTFKLTFYTICIIVSITIIITSWCFYFAPHHLIY